MHMPYNSHEEANKPISHEIAHSNMDNMGSTVRTCSRGIHQVQQVQQYCSLSSRDHWIEQMSDTHRMYSSSASTEHPHGCSHVYALGPIQPATMQQISAV